MQYRQAVLVIHGMGEQRPLETLSGFADAVLSQFSAANRQFYSRPAKVSDSYEGRRYIIPPIYEAGADARPQIELFEYHWSHLMTGNRLDDLFGTMRQVLFQWPWRVPGGILGLWLVLWLLIGGAAWALTLDPVAHLLPGLSGDSKVVGVLAGTGILGMAITYLLTRLVPRWLTRSFVDVARYLDTSPRSYEVRRDIREGVIKLLGQLNDRYDRVIVVGHSLGSYIAYDAIRYLWGQHNLNYASDPPQSPPPHGAVPAGLDNLEAAARTLLVTEAPTEDQVSSFRDAQRALAAGLRAHGHTWRITDLISLGSPMYMADQIYTRNEKEFMTRVSRHEFPVCPPVEDYPSWRSQNEPPRALRYTYCHNDRRVLYDGAVFAVVRWTNLWFPTAALLLGDYFGGPLAPLFGRGVLDVPVTSGDKKRLIPGFAHALYYATIARYPNQQLAQAFHKAMKL